MRARPRFAAIGVVAILAAETNDVIGSGTIQASHWADASQGGGQWNCSFDFSATVTGAPWTTPVSRLDEGRAARELKLTWKASAKT